MLFPEIYGQLEEGAGVSVDTSICEMSVGVVVYHRSMVD